MPLDDGGGAGGNRDRFYFMDVPTMWDMLQHHDSAPHQQALKGWRQSYELVLMHKTQVEKYKDKLITAWPPERSKAAQAYVERLDHLIESLGETFEAAIANYTAYSTAIAAVDDAKRKLAEIQQEHTANAAAIAKHDDEVRNTPRAYGKAIAPPPPPSPVADGRQEQLRLQAAGLMTGLSAELATAQMSLTAPKPYNPTRIVNDSEQVGNDGFALIPPPTLSAPGTPRTSSIKSKASSSTNDHIKNRNISDSDRQGTPGKNPTKGPVLGGTNQPLTPTPSTGIPSTAPTNPGSGVASSGPPALPSSRSTPPSTTYPRPTSTPTPAFGATPPTSAVKGSSPLHGVIGGTPPTVGIPPGRPGSSGISSHGTQRVNPFGGMIGQSSTTPPGRRTESRREGDQRHQRWEPDNPWEVDGGIDPVLLPAEEKRITLGPTIGER